MTSFDWKNSNLAPCKLAKTQKVFRTVIQTLKKNKDDF